MQEQALVSIAPWTFIATICNLLIQVYLIKRFLFKPINQVVEKRRAMADVEIVEAEKAKKEAGEIKKEYEQNMEDARKKAREILASAQTTAVLQSEELLKEAAAQAEVLKEKAEKEIVQEKRKALEEIKGEIGDIALEIAEKILEREICAEDHAHMIEAFMKNAEEAS